MRSVLGASLLIRILTAALVSLALASIAWGSTSFEILHNFGGSKDGTQPSGALFVDSKGNLYGATGGGPGEYGFGTVFVLMPQGHGRWKESILHSFGGASDGAAPQGGLISDRMGNLYGTLYGDNGAAIGGVFELSPSPGGWTNTILYTNGFGLSEGPGLLMNDLGSLFGEAGTGLYKSGAIGELFPEFGGCTYTALYSFCSQYGCPDGYEPPAPPIWDGKGNLYGTATYGGIYRPACVDGFGCGVIFKMTPNKDGTWTYHVLHRFASSFGDGQNPFGGLVMDAAGNFYGSTWFGGPNGRGNGGYGHGTVFKLAFTSGRWKETILWDFPNCLQGCMAMGTPALDKAGNLYGTAAGGTGSCAGMACGVVFKLAPQTNGKWKYSVVHNLTAADGGVQPFYGVILDGKGNLFGVTSNFGKYGAGTAFRITP
jgi:hypothetical protein